MTRCACWWVLWLPLSALAADQPLAQWTGADFDGGGKKRFGTTHLGVQDANVIYARPTDSMSDLRARFKLDRVPDEAFYLVIKGRDDDGPDRCKIEVTLNGVSVFKGPNPYPANEWRTRSLRIPSGALRTGDNLLAIANIEDDGHSGAPPWFMVASAAIVPERDVQQPDMLSDFQVILPEKQRDYPEPLKDGQEPGFKIRGTKGWGWTPEQYLEEIPLLAKYKMNFLMNCYLSLFHGQPAPTNRWSEPLPEDLKAGLVKVFQACRDHGINFCFAVHPQLGAAKPLNLSSDEDFEKLWSHYAWAQSQGVRWFSVPLDDVHLMPGVKIDGAEHARLVNKLFARLREKDPQAQLIFCPTWYWSDGTDAKYKPYLESLGKELHADVYLFWTGNEVVGKVTRVCAETYRNIVKHRIVLWDNYPVNDRFPAMHLGPVVRRDADLCEVLDGYMSNPMCSQNQINRIPLLTCADYAYNPRAYDPWRSIGQAIVHLAETSEQRQLLKELVEAYAGMFIYDVNSTAFNSVRHQYGRLAGAPHCRWIAEMYIKHVESLAARMGDLFPGRFAAERKTVLDDVRWMQGEFAARYGQ